ncbi:MAG: hydrolase [Deltaproteobacteria bacterium]|nr:hydrolase [Deltaproteobacteria bacterium]MBW2660683.1 hydrolase [Deltaproteobacteria bacterium]
MLNFKNTVLVIIDVQGKLAQLMHGKSMLFDNLQRIIKGSRVLDIPIVWVEQNPEGLGPTIPEVADLLSDIQPISKYSFSCCGSDTFLQELDGLNRKQVLITGIETHICVYQTAVDLLDLQYEVQVVSDAVASRTAENIQIGLEKIRDAGGALTSTETALFELIKVGKGDKFKEILRLVK